MKAFFMSIVLLACLDFYCGISYSAEDRRNVQPQPPPSIPQVSRQQTHTPRPILPPVIFSPSGASPTLSPHIAAPPIPRTIIHNVPRVPTYAPAPIHSDLGTELEPIPITGTSLGRVSDIESRKDGTSWIVVEDELFGETLKIKIYPEATTIINKATVMSFKDIKEGDMVNVIFSQEGEDIKADFVSILTEEDLKAMEEASRSRSTVAPEEDSLPSEE